MMDRSLFTLPKVGMVMGIMLVACLAQAACVLGEAYALARAITNLWEGAPLADQAVLVAVFAVCFVGKQAIVFARDTFLARYSRDRACDLRDQLLDGVFGQDGNERSGIVSEHGTAAVTQAALDGIDQVETYLAIILPKIVGVVAIPLPLLVSVFVIDPISGVILLVFFPVIIFFMILIGRQASARAETQYETYNALSNHFIDTLRGIETLKVFGRSKGYGERIFASSERFRSATIETLKVATLSSGVLDLIATLGVAAVSLMLGFRLLDGFITLFPALMTLILSPEYFKPVRDFAGDFHASLDGKNALKNITAMVGGTPRESADIGLDAWSDESVLRFDNVSYAYDGTETAETPGEKTDAPAALSDVSFKVKGFAKVGIVGVSGSGKTTLVNLLGGFARPTGGSMGVAGTRTSSLQQPAWQRQLLYIPQNPYIFHASLRDNICFYTPNATDEAVAHAVEVCGLDEMVEQLPEGIDTVIGEGGRGLSGGQAQRIALARVLLDTSRSVLLFDEPTAHLDIETELELKERMLPLMEGRLVFFATHRLHWLSDMDYILVMDEGRVVEAGTLEDLLARKSRLVALASEMNRGEVA